MIRSAIVTKDMLSARRAIAFALCAIAVALLAAPARAQYDFRTIVGRDKAPATHTSRDRTRRDIVGVERFAVEISISQDESTTRLTVGRDKEGTLTFVGRGRFDPSSIVIAEQYTPVVPIGVESRRPAAVVTRETRAPSGVVGVERYHPPSLVTSDISR